MAAGGVFLPARKTSKGKMSRTTAWHLSEDPLVHIFSFLSAEDIGRAAGVCRRWAELAEDRRVWRGKRYLSEGGRGLAEALPVARALPPLERVFVRRGEVFRVYLSGQLADFEVPDLRNEVTTSVISSLVTENLSLDFSLVEETSGNCLVVQRHGLKRLHVNSDECHISRRATAAKLGAIARALSDGPLPKLQSVHVCTRGYSNVLGDDVEIDILRALATCPGLYRLSLQTRYLLSWHALVKFSKLGVLHLEDCIIEDISFLDLCPELHSLSLDYCSPLASRELSRKSELRTLVLRRLPVGTEVLDALCRACPELESVVLDRCMRVGHTLFLENCPRLRFLEMNGSSRVVQRLVDLPTELRHLKLHSLNVTSDTLAEIVKGLTRLEILDVVNSDFGSLRFLRLCPSLTELCLGQKHCDKFEDFYELGGLRNLQKLYLNYGGADVEPLEVILGKLPRLEALNVTFQQAVTDVSFLRHCHRLRSLVLRCERSLDAEPSRSSELANLTELTELVLDYCLDVKTLGRVLPSMPYLEVLHIRLVDAECDFSFLGNCLQLTSLRLECSEVRVWDFAQLRHLRRLRRLTLIGLSEEHLPSLVKEVSRLPRLENVCLDWHDSNFLESWEWHRLLSSLNLRTETEIIGQPCQWETTEGPNLIHVLEYGDNFAVSSCYDYYRSARPRESCGSFVFDPDILRYRRRWRCSPCCGCRKCQLL